VRHHSSTSLSRIVPLRRVCALAGVARSSVYAGREAKVRLALADLPELYNREWMIERHGHRPPSEARRAYYARPENRVEKLAA
jgi:hypothetical protein